MDMFDTKKQQGFTILYAMIISSIVLATVLSIAAISLKQRNISGLGENSQLAFYAANSGMECALYWALNGREISLDGGGTTTIDIFKIPIGSNSEIDFQGNYDSVMDDSDNDDQVALRADVDESNAQIPCFERDIFDNAGVYAFDTQYDFKDDSDERHWFEAIRGDEVESTTGASLNDLCGAGFVNGDDDTPDDGDVFRVWIFRTILPVEGSISQQNACAEVAVCRRLDEADLSISSRGYNTCDINSRNIVERAVRLTQQ